MSDDATKNEEESLFLSEMGDVTPLKPANRISTSQKPKKAFRQADTEDEDYIVDDVFSTTEILEDCPDILSFSRGGLQHNALKKLRQGKNPVEYTLDLHGLTVDQARTELAAFLSECELAGYRHVIIVHGKGFRSRDKPVIKPMVNRWLRAADNVLAFHSAQARDGGSGAVYVLLKSRT